MLAFGLLLWPGLYEYSNMGSSVVRINRITQSAHLLTAEGWIGLHNQVSPVEQPITEETKALPEEAVAATPPPKSLEERFVEWLGTSEPKGCWVLRVSDSNQTQDAAPDAEETRLLGRTLKQNIDVEFDVVHPYQSVDPQGLHRRARIRVTNHSGQTIRHLWMGVECKLQDGSTGLKHWSQSTYILPTRSESFELRHSGIAGLLKIDGASNFWGDFKEPITGFLVAIGRPGQE